MSRFISERRARGAKLAGLLAIAGVVASCDLGKVTVGTTIPQVVVHATLNPNATTQVVLVEQTLTGTITVPNSAFDPSDPIVSGGGVPIRGATVTITDPNGKTYAAVEDAALPGSKKGAGVYRVPLSGGQLILGGSYQLRIRTGTGDEVTASTRIPQPLTRALGAVTRTLNRDHDTLDIRWSTAAGARSYAVRVESPFGPFVFLTDSTHFRLTGDLRNPFSNDLEHLLIPGFHQDIVIGAVDSNFYDYYRTGNDPFTGSGIISRINGGVGFFGSIVELTTGTLSVVADQTDSIEGRYRLLNGQSTTNGMIAQFNLYVESKAARDNLPDALSGRYATPSPNSVADGILGERSGTNVTLAFLYSQLAGDTAEVFEGIQLGDTLKGRYRVNGGTAVFVRSP